MSLTHAILGLLTLQPMTGYDLKHLAFDSTVAHFWQADQAQIYRTLEKMEQSGWLTSTLEIQTERPNKRVYAVTPAGQIELRHWLETSQPLAIHREAFLVQLFFSASLPNAVILQHIDAQAALHRERLAQFQKIPLPELTADGIERREKLWRLTLEFGLLLEQTYLEWLNLCQQTVSTDSEDA